MRLGVGVARERRELVEAGEVGAQCRDALAILARARTTRRVAFGHQARQVVELGGGVLWQRRRRVERMQRVRQGIGLRDQAAPAQPVGVIGGHLAQEGREIRAHLGGERLGAVEPCEARLAIGQARAVEREALDRGLPALLGDGAQRGELVDRLGERRLLAEGGLGRLVQPRELGREVAQVRARGAQATLPTRDVVVVRALQARDCRRASPDPRRSGPAIGRRTLVRAA